MAKQLKSTEKPHLRINTVEHALLEFIEASPGNRMVCAKSVAAESLGVSVPTVTRAMRRLESLGLLIVCERFLRSGAQIENEYEVSQLGRELLHTFKPVR